MANPARRESALESNEEFFWRLPDVQTRVGLSKTEIYRRIREGSFPHSRRYRPKGSGVYWLSSEVRRWQVNEVNQTEQSW